jgi:hypothetical protein
MQAMGACELVEEAGLPHPGLADHRRQLAVAVGRKLLGAAKLLDLRVTAHEARQPAAGGRLQPGPGGAGSRHLVHVHVLHQSLHGYRTQRLHGDVSLHQLECRRGQQNAAGAGELLHASGEMGCLADGRVVHAEIAADGPHHDLARVQPDADLDVHAVGMTRVLRVALDELLHPERRIAGPDGVILMGERGAEERHDPVAHDLVHRPLVPVDGLHHPFQHGIEDVPGLLGIAIGQELHRALEVREEYRDLFAFPFESALRGEDLLGEVLWGVELG